MKNDAFSRFHPAVNFLYFAGAIGCGMLVQHPAYVLSGLIQGILYFFLIYRSKSWKPLLSLFVLFVFLSAINPLLNTAGNTPLCYLFGRPYTLEALLYGICIAGIFTATILWFGCYSKVLTGDKFTCLFGNLIPAISLLLVMIFRLVPNFIRKTAGIVGTRKSIGKGAADTAGLKEKLQDGIVVFGALTSWALEGSIVTGDSMRARGYGCAKRTSFTVYRMTSADLALLLLMLGLVASVITAACTGQFLAVFTPVIRIAPVSWGLAAYNAFLVIPTALHIKEEIQWYISRSTI